MIGSVIPRSLNHHKKEFTESRQVDKNPINPDSNPGNFGSLICDRMTPQPKTNLVIEILSSDEEYDSEFEVLS
jgi:hypothetical protein